METNEAVLRFATETLAAERALLEYERAYRNALLTLDLLDAGAGEVEEAARLVIARWPEGRDGLARRLAAARERAYAAVSAETLEYVAI